MMNKCEKKSLNILVVEDDPRHQEIITEAIKEASVQNNLVCFDSGAESIRYLQREGQYGAAKDYQRPDMILLDLKLPGMDGKEVLRSIKSNEDTRVIPVIMLTSSENDQDLKECYMLGANGYVTKPVSCEEFTEVVRAIPFYWAFVNTLPMINPQGHLRNSENMFNGPADRKGKPPK
jgi:two-component system response regulator